MLNEFQFQMNQNHSTLLIIKDKDEYNTFSQFQIIIFKYVLTCIINRSELVTIKSTDSLFKKLINAIVNAEQIGNELLESFSNLGIKSR